MKTVGTSVLKRDWTVCSKYDNHSRFDIQHNWRDLNDHSMRLKISTSVMI